MAKRRAGETLVVPGHPQYEPGVFDRLAEHFERKTEFSEFALALCASDMLEEQQN